MKGRKGKEEGKKKEGSGGEQSRRGCTSLELNKSSLQNCHNASYTGHMSATYQLSSSMGFTRATIISVQQILNAHYITVKC